jgi:hypothetical protein
MKLPVAVGARSLTAERWIPFIEIADAKQQG